LFLPERDGKPVANRVEGGKRPRSSVSPIIVLDADGNPLAIVGSPGSSRIIGYVVQTLIAMLDWGLDGRRDSCRREHRTNQAIRLLHDHLEVRSHVRIVHRQARGDAFGDWGGVDGKGQIVGTSLRFASAQGDRAFAANFDGNRNLVGRFSGRFGPPLARTGECYQSATVGISLDEM
jgi:hypothetical protein